MHCFEEAELVDVQSALVTQGKLIQNHTANAKVVNDRLFSVWQEFNAHEITILELHVACSEIMQEVQTFR